MFISFLPIISNFHSLRKGSIISEKVFPIPNINISSEVNFTELNVAYYNSSGAMWQENIVIPNLIQWIGCNLTRVNGQDIKDGILDYMDILIFPGGEPPLYMAEVGVDGKAKIQEFLDNGGGYMGFCAGTFYASSYTSWKGLAGADPLLEAPDELLELYDGTAVGHIFEIVDFPVPGYAMTEINFETKNHMITNGQPDTMTFWYGGGPYFDLNGTDEVTVLGTYDVIDKPAMICFDYGQGKVFLSGPHPEFEEDDSRDGLDIWDAELNDVESDWPLLKEVIRWLATPSRNEIVPGYLLIFPVTLLVILVQYIRVKKKQTTIKLN